MILDLAIKSFRHRKFTATLTILSIALSVALLLGIEKIRSNAENGFINTISGTDLIVGARTSPIQLLLSSVFHLGYTTNSISEETQQMLQNHPKVKWSIPISLGDSFKGFNVIGTTDSFYKHYRFAQSRRLEFGFGTWFGTDSTTHNKDKHSFEAQAVIGSEVAQSLGLTLEDTLVISHGSGEDSFIEHTDSPLTVSGLLKPTGTPVDRAVLVPLIAIEHMHSDLYADHEEHAHDPFSEAGKKLQSWFDTMFSHDHDDNAEEVNPHHGSNHHDQHKDPHQDRHGDHGSNHDSHHNGHHNGHHDDHDTGHQSDHLLEGGLSAMLVGLHSRSAAISLQREFNEYEPEAISAILPGVVLLELWQVIGIVEKILLLISIMVITIGLFSMLIILMTSMHERRREIAILRSIGASPGHLFSLIMGEALVITTAGITVGIGLLYFAIAMLQPWLESSLGIYIINEWLTMPEILLIGIVLLSGVFAGLIPSIRAYRYSLNDGLTIKN